MRAWLIRAGKSGEREAAALEGGRAIAGWFETGDLGQIKDRAELRDLLGVVYQSASRPLLANWTGQLWNFVRIIAPGDIVALPLKGEPRGIVLGRVSGPYTYDEAAPPGFRHVRQVEWIRTIPRSSLDSDLLDSLGALLTVAELRRHDAATRLDAVMKGNEDPGWLPIGAHAADLASKEDLISKAVSSATSDPLRVTIRQLISLWGVSRRTDSSLAVIEQELADAGLRAVPRIAEGWLDNLVVLAAIDEGDTEAALSDNFMEQLSGDAPPASLTISTLRSATSKVVSVRDDDSLVKAITLMIQHDYSQLPVVNAQGDITGVVSWESIGKARLSTQDPDLQTATVPARTVPVNADLLGVVAEVATRDYVFVHDLGGHAPIGVVTVADLAAQFHVMARPFALVEEVERRLRRSTDERVPVALMKAAVGGKGTHVASAANLTMGSYKHLYKSIETFALLDWPLDHGTFFELLSEVHRIRNSLMHFSTDPLSEAELTKASAFVQMLRLADPRP